MKEYAPKQKFLPPSRALLAEINGSKHTATWVLDNNQRSGWRCFSASRGLRWMRGMVKPNVAKEELSKRKLSWQWIVPLTATTITPPFER